MARKTQIAKLLDEASGFPWWLLLIFACISYVGIRFGLPLIQLVDPVAATVVTGFTTGLSAFAWVPALILVVAAAGSFLKARNRRRLLESQSGIKSIGNESWQGFEKLVGETYRRQGYAVTENGGNGSDGGVDLILRKKSETVLVQCKQWRKQKVGVKIVRELLGVVTAKSATRGIIVALGTFTREAEIFASENGIELVEGEALTSMVSFVQNSCQGPQRSHKTRKQEIKEFSDSVEPECPSCGSDMVLRMANKGTNAGNQFLGCSTFPKCRGTRKVA